MILGLPLQTCMNIVNVIGEEVKAGKSFNPGNSYADILQDPFKCAFQAVDRQFYRDYVGYALWFYENDRFPLVQCFWPDKEQRLPWDSGCDEYVKNSQPMLSGTSRLC
jgi:hypothetical protein